MLPRIPSCLVRKNIRRRGGKERRDGSGLQEGPLHPGQDRLQAPAGCADPGLGGGRATAPGGHRPLCGTAGHCKAQPTHTNRHRDTRGRRGAQGRLSMRHLDALARERETCAFLPHVTELGAQAPSSPRPATSTLPCEMTVQHHIQTQHACLFCKLPVPAFCQFFYAIVSLTYRIFYSKLRILILCTLYALQIFFPGQSVPFSVVDAVRFVQQFVCYGLKHLSFMVVLSLT